MGAGYTLLQIGMIRMKNVNNTIVKNLLDQCLAGIGWWGIGFGLAFGNGIFCGNKYFLGIGVMEDKMYGLWFLEYTYCSLVS